MRISSVKVNGLFGLFDYTIPLKLEDRVTIIHGPNGCGKTTILKMLFSLFAQRFGEVSGVKFKDLEILFDTGQALKVMRVLADTTAKTTTRRGRASRHQYHLEFALVSDPEQKPWKWIGLGDKVNFPLGSIQAHLPFVTRVDEATWFDEHAEEPLSLEQVIAKYGDHLPFLGNRMSGQEMPQWLKAILDQVEVHFIQTQRLLRLGPDTRNPTERQGHRAMVLEYSEDVVGQIRSTLAKLVQLSQQLDRNFPARVLNTRGDTAVTSAQIRERYEKQQTKQKRLEAVGLISIEFEVPFPDREPEEVERRVLSLYLDDMDKKLAGFDELLQKIEVLTDMINSRFLNKSFGIDREKGFLFNATDADKSRIPLEALSSGEQHELVLSYELLFRVKRGSLILIDEPELSLHVGWQHRFLGDLDRISKLTGLDFLVATHSPQIIHKRWDLALSLGEGE